LTSVYIATALLSEILTNNAAGAIMYPIAAIAGDALGIPAKKVWDGVWLLSCGGGEW
jgi:di/tricarboxylate transporter